MGHSQRLVLPACPHAGQTDGASLPTAVGYLCLAASLAPLLGPTTDRVSDPKAMSPPPASFPLARGGYPERKRKPCPR